VIRCHATKGDAVLKIPFTELLRFGYRLQIHVRDGRVRLYTINGGDWSKRYPRIVESRARVAPNCL
jgi:hypothetical protein